MPQPRRSWRPGLRAQPARPPRPYGDATRMRRPVKPRPRLSPFWTRSFPGRAVPNSVSLLRGKSSAIRGNQALIKRNQIALASAKSFIINERAGNLPKRTFEYCTHPCHWTGGNLSREERLNACSSGPRSFSPKPPNKVSPQPLPPANHERIKNRASGNPGRTFVEHEILETA